MQKNWEIVVVIFTTLSERPNTKNVNFVAGPPLVPFTTYWVNTGSV